MSNKQVTTNKWIRAHTACRRLGWQFLIMSEKWLNESPNAGQWLLEVDGSCSENVWWGSSQRPTVTPGNHLPSPTTWPKPPSDCFAASVWMEEPDFRNSYSKNARFQVSLLLGYFMSVYRETRKIGSKLKKSQIIVAAPSVQPAQPPGATPNRRIKTHLYLATGGCIISNMADNSWPICTRCHVTPTSRAAGSLRLIKLINVGIWT